MLLTVTLLFSICVCVCDLSFLYFFFFKQKTAYEMRISDWSSDVCSSDLHREQPDLRLHIREGIPEEQALVLSRGALDMLLGPLPIEGGDLEEIGRASCRERVCQYV